MNSKLSIAIASILGGVSFSAAAADQAGSSTDVNSDTLQEITVTATRRSQSMQDVPIAMQAFTGQALQQLNVSTFDDYIKYLPNVTSANNGPGQNEIFMRGLSAGAQPSQGSGSTGLYPNVAIYFDNQSGQLPNRNLDIYAADIDRIEVLEGPQGTLFGSGAEAGAIRYITNAPKLDVTEGNTTAGYSVTAHGDPNTNITAVLNLPLIADTMAVRAVIYNDRRGGYIDNVPATFTRKNTDIGIHYANYAASATGACPDGLPNNGFCVPPGSPSINNATVAARAINPVTYQGARGEVQALLAREAHVRVAAGGTRVAWSEQPDAGEGHALGALGDAPDDEREQRAEVAFERDLEQQIFQRVERRGSRLREEHRLECNPTIRDNRESSNGETQDFAITCNAGSLPLSSGNDPFTRMVTFRKHCRRRPRPRNIHDIVRRSGDAATQMDRALRKEEQTFAIGAEHACCLFACTQRG